MKSRLKSKLFSPFQISQMSDAEIRKEYSRLRSVANKRLGRLQSQGLGKTARSGYRFPKISDILSSSKSTVASELADVSKWLRGERSTLTGEKQFISRFQEVMTEKGYADLVQTPEDIYKLLDFMDEMRELEQDKMYSSGDLLDAFQEAERLNIPEDKLKENLDAFVANMESLKDVKPSKGGRIFSKKRISNLIRKWTERK